MYELIFRNIEKELCIRGRFINVLCLCFVTTYIVLFCSDRVFLFKETQNGAKPSPPLMHHSHLDEGVDRFGYQWIQPNSLITRGRSRIKKKEWSYRVTEPFQVTGELHHLTKCGNWLKITCVHDDKYPRLWLFHPMELSRPYLVKLPQ